MTEKNNFMLSSTGPNLDDAEASLEKMINDAKAKYVNIGTEVGREYEVTYFLGNDPKKGGINGKGSSYDDAVKNALETSGIRSILGYNQLINIKVEYSMTKEEEKQMKTKSPASPSGPAEKYSTRMKYF